MADKWQTDPAFPKTNLMMLDEGMLCDVTFVVGERKQTVNAHRFMLASRSPVFCAMFCGPLAESGDVILIPDIEEDIFKLVLRYIYTADCTLNPDTVMALLYAANKYELIGLSTSCAGYLESKLSPDNICTVLQQAHAFNDKLLLTKCLDFLCKNGSECIQSDGFLSLSIDVLKLILKSNELSANEEDVYTACVKWAEEQCRRNGEQVTDAKCRVVLGDVLTLIRFPLMSIETFASVVSERDILTSHEKISLFQYFAIKKQQTNVDMFSCAPRTGVKVSVCRLPQGLLTPWTHNGRTDAIDFSCSVPCRFTSVGLFTPMAIGAIQGSLKVYEGNRELMSQDININYQPAINYTEIKLTESLKLNKDTKYTVAQTCNRGLRHIAAMAMAVNPLWQQTSWK